MKFHCFPCALSSGSVITIGNFDGCHLGHQELINQVQQEAQRRHLTSAVILFEPHPKEFFLKDKAPARLLTLREKLERFAGAGIDHVICFRFTQALAALSPTAFVEDFLMTQLKMQCLIVGEDFRFGHKREGDVTFLEQLGQKQGFDVLVLPAYCAEPGKISSTSVRELLARGDFATARQLLGRPYTLSGRVIYGNQRGRELGFPTANISLKRQVSPLHGIYLVKVRGPFKGEKWGVASIGTRPTFEETEWWLEVFLLEWAGSLYGQRLIVEFLQKIRDEKRFDSVSELIAQMKQDVQEAKKSIQIS